MGALRWSEQLDGFVSQSELDFNQALLDGRRRDSRASLRLSLQIDDVAAFLAREPRRARTVSGSLALPGLYGTMDVWWGAFELFGHASPVDDRLRLRMRYRLNVTTDRGHELRVAGFKLVENDPGFDSWADTTTLFVRVFRGRWATGGGEARPGGKDACGRDARGEEAESVVDPWGQEPESADDEASSAIVTGVLQMSPGSVLREFASFRASARGCAGTRDTAGFARLFASGLAKAYAGPPTSGGRPSFPQDRTAAPWQREPGLKKWLDVPERSDDEGVGRRRALQRSVVPYRVADLPFALNLHHMRLAGAPPEGIERCSRGPVLLVPGAGLRAQMFYAQPVGRTLVDELLELGFDVWVQNWRGSIDLPANSYTLDRVAFGDHPAAVKKVLKRTGAPSLSAVVHCMGSASFVMACAAGVFKEGRVTHVVSSGVSLFFEVPDRTLLKQYLTLPAVRVFGTGADPQWGIRAPTPAGRVLARVAHTVQFRCGSGPCEVANFIYGSGPQVLLNHENVDVRVHDWGARELGYSPFSLIHQVHASCRTGRVVPAGRLPGDPPDYLARKPRSGGTLFTFMGGTSNEMFLCSGQRRAAETWQSFELPAKYVQLEGIGHLDTFWARQAPEAVFPHVINGLP